MNSQNAHPAPRPSPAHRPSPPQPARPNRPGTRPVARPTSGVDPRAPAGQRVSVVPAGRDRLVPLSIAGRPEPGGRICHYYMVHNHTCRVRFEHPSHCPCRERETETGTESERASERVGKRESASERAGQRQREGEEGQPPTLLRVDGRRVEVEPVHSHA
jgi:hypothetical protein